MKLLIISSICVIRDRYYSMNQLEIRIKRFIYKLCIITNTVRMKNSEF